MPRRYSVSPRNSTISERFWLKVDRHGPVPEHCPDLGPCWVWTAARTRDGYGTFWDGTRPVQAARFAWAEIVGPIDGGLLCRHHCRNPHCVSPRHLFLVPRSASGQAKLTWADVTAIREQAARGATQRALGRRFGVSHVAIGFVLRGKTWHEDRRPA